MTTLVAVIFVIGGLVAALGVIVLASWLGASEAWGSTLGGLTIGATLFWVGRSPRK